MLSDLKILVSWRYIFSVYTMVRISLRRQYKATFFGMVWSLLNPLVQILILTFVFTHIMRFNLPNYVLYVIGGLLSWQLIVGGLQGCGESIISRGQSLKSVVVSKTVFPVADCLVHIYMYFLSLVALLLIAFVFVSDFHWTVFFVPVAVLPLLVFVLAGSIAVAYLTPYFRDLSHIMLMGFSAAFWATPIIYPLSLIPERFRWVLELNPFYQLIRPVQTVVYGATIPSPEVLLLSWAVAFAGVVLAYAIHRRGRTRVIFYI